MKPAISPVSVSPDPAVPSPALPVGLMNTRPSGDATIGRQASVQVAGRRAVLIQHISAHDCSEAFDVEVRILQGIHFRTADKVARKQGKSVADYVFENFLRPLN